MKICGPRRFSRDDEEDDDWRRANTRRLARGGARGVDHNQSINQSYLAIAIAVGCPIADGRAFFFILWILFGLWFDDVIRFAILKHLEDHER